MDVKSKDLNIYEQRLYQGQALLDAQIAVWKEHPELLKLAEPKYQEYMMPLHELQELYRQRWNSGQILDQ